MRLPIASYGRNDCFALVALLAVLAFGALAAAEVGHVWWMRLLALPPALVAIPIIWFFRDPDRSIPQGVGQLVSPADGVVADIGVVHDDDYLCCDALRIGIFLSPLNVHVNRSPLKGTVEHVRYRPGRFGPAFQPEAADRNESCTIGLRSLENENLRVLVRQVVGAVARRIVCPLAPGDQLDRGERFGMIKFGSRTELWIPISAGFEPRVEVGDHVLGGATILGDLKVPGATADLTQQTASTAPV